MTPELLTLHRYFIWANRMRVHFETAAAPFAELVRPDAEIDETTVFESTLYMSYWYGGLYVVIEGWKDLNLSDSVIDELLKSPNVGLLKRYRHGVFHFQRDYFDKRFTEFMDQGIDAVTWVRSLNEQFGRYFLELPR
jgi:hypothetical protein